MLGLDAIVRDALLEDIGRGDATTEATVPEDARCKARLYAKQDGVLSGINVFRNVFHQLNASVTGWHAKKDGDRFRKDDDIALFEGNTRAVLSGERVALNFVAASMVSMYASATRARRHRDCASWRKRPFVMVADRTIVSRCTMGF